MALLNNAKYKWNLYFYSFMGVNGKILLSREDAIDAIQIQELKFFLKVTHWGTHPHTRMEKKSRT
jgi:hypothetical protein